MKPLSLLLLGLAVALSGLSAAEDQPHVFRTVGLGESYGDLFYDNHGKAVLITTNDGSFSNDYPAPAGVRLSLYRNTPPPPNAPPGTPPTRTVVAEITYPAEAARVILLLYPGPSGAALPVSGLAIPDPVGSHGEGHARILNLSSLTAAFGADKSFVQVPPHSTDHRVPFDAGPLQLKIAAQTGHGWQVVMAMERNLPANLRLFVVLVDAPPSYDGGPPVRSTLVYDFVRTPFKGRWP